MCILVFCCFCFFFSPPPPPERTVQLGPLLVLSSGEFVSRPTHAKSIRSPANKITWDSRKAEWRLLRTTSSNLTAAMCMTNIHFGHKILVNTEIDLVIQSYLTLTRFSPVNFTINHFQRYIFHVQYFKRYFCCSSGVFCTKVKLVFPRNIL